MSLIKAVDVPKHMADKMRSRRLAARLSGSAEKPVAAAKDVADTAPIATDTPTT